MLPKIDNSVAAYDAASRIHAKARADKFDGRSRAYVKSVVRRYPRSPEVALAAAEFGQLELQARGLPRSLADWKSKTERRARLYRRALALDPKLGRAWEGLADVLDIGERYAEAARAAERAIKFGNDPDSIAILARIRAQQGKRAESRRLAASVIRSRSEWARRTAKEVRAGEWDPDR